MCGPVTTYNAPMSAGGRKVDTRTTGDAASPRRERASSAADPLAETRPAEGVVVGATAGTTDDDSALRGTDAFDTDRIAPSLPTALFERYKINRKLGAGGMGVVYEALDMNLHRVVALKVLKLADEDPTQLAEAANRLVREARTMAVLSHKNVVTVYDVGMHGMQVYVAMQLVDGVTLRKWLSAQPRKTSDILKVVCEAGAGLAAAHRARLVHRDFKPDNVLVSKRGSVRVTDFGLARRANFASGAPEDHRGMERTSTPKVIDNLSVESVTRSGAVLGTPAYMPPEQSEGRPCDARADQFSFCVTVWEAVYGTRPFEGNSWSQLYSNLVAGNIIEPDPRKRVPRQIQKALRRGLSVEPADRFATMDELLDILQTGIKRPRNWLRYGVIPIASAAAAGLITTVVLKQDAPSATPAPQGPLVVNVTTPPAPTPAPPAPAISTQPIEATAPPPADPAPAIAKPDAPKSDAPKSDAKADTRADKRRKQPGAAATTSTTSSTTMPAGSATTTTEPVVETPAPKVDPLAEIRTKRGGLEGRMKQRGLLASDLPRAATLAMKDADAAIATGDAAKAETAIAAAETAIDGVAIDYAFINAKLMRISDQVGDSTGREEELRTFLAKLKTLVDAKKYRDANALLNDMAARLAKK